MPSHADGFLETLLEDGAFLEFETAVAAEYPAQTAVRVGVLCDVARRVADLDAEDFESMANYPAIPAGVAGILRACTWPRTRKSQPRGALESLRATFGVLLEVLRLRLLREEVNDVLAILHLAADYLPILAWQSVLGHAADPSRLRASIDTAGARWRTQDDPCLLTDADRRTLRRAVFVVGRTDVDECWWGFITRQHSHLASALACCAGAPGLRRSHSPHAVCANPCSFLPHDPAERTALAWRAELARRFLHSPLIRLRHGSPVGHFFAVPDVPTLQEAWTSTWALLVPDDDDAPSPNPLAGNGSPALADGIALLFGAVAGGRQPLRETNALDQLRECMRSELRSIEPERPVAASAR